MPTVVTIRIEERCSCGATFGGTFESTLTRIANMEARIAAESWRQTHQHGIPRVRRLTAVKE